MRPAFRSLAASRSAPSGLDDARGRRAGGQRSDRAVRSPVPAPILSLTRPRPPRSCAPLLAAPPDIAVVRRSTHRLRRRIFAAALFILPLLLLLSAASPRHACAPALPFQPPSPPSSAFAFLPISPCGLDGAPRFPDPSLPRLNTLQLDGTHNSYHVQPAWIALSSKWRYSHAPLAVQLALGIRSLELDVHWTASPGCWAVFHQPFVDARSRCGCLSDCLAQIRAWSLSNPEHALIAIVLEPKYAFDSLSGRNTFTPDALRALQAVILSSLPNSSILHPFSVQGNQPSLLAAVSPSNCGWPSAAETRGGFALLLDVWRENAAAGAALRSLPLSDRLFFLRAASAGESDDAVYLEQPGCCLETKEGVECMKRMAAAVGAGYLVRASVVAPEGCGGGGGGEGAYREKVVGSGAQLLVQKDAVKR